MGEYRTRERKQDRNVKKMDSKGREEKGGVGTKAHEIGKAGRRRSGLDGKGRERIEKKNRKRKNRKKKE